jgi:hypothetical protein
MCREARLSARTFTNIRAFFQDTIPMFVVEAQKPSSATSKIINGTRFAAKCRSQINHIGARD